MNIFYEEAPPPVLFLDIDGPLIPQRAYWLPANMSGEGHVKYFDPIAVALFNDIFVKLPQLKIVFSTSWAYVYDDEKLLEFFKMNGLNITKEMLCEKSRTQKSHDSKRGSEIQAWLNVHPKVTTYVVIDDSWEVITLNKEHVVMVNFDEGFLFTHYLKTLTVLGFDFGKDTDYVNKILLTNKRFIHHEY